MLAAKVTAIQQAMPMRVGRTAATSVHLKLPVSFLMVSSVVEQGKWKRLKSITFIAVTAVHPFDTNRFFISHTDDISVRLPFAV